MNHATLPAVRTASPSPKAEKLDSRTLFGEKRELLIVHQGEAYRLTITRQNKLILTK